MQKNKINKTAKSYLAKLLATENISVEHRKVKTAFFDLKQRLLVVPIWKEMNKDILDLLLSHEIGHALFTPQQEWKDAIVNSEYERTHINNSDISKDRYILNNIPDEVCEKIHKYYRE